MAAHDSVKVDPALERWNNMRETAYKRFRWTNSSAFAAVVGLVAIPTVCYCICAMQDAKYSWNMRRRGETLRIE